MNLRLFVTLALMACAYAAHAEVSVTSVTAQQRYPQNGLVDIAVTFIGESNAVAQLKCMFAATNTATKTGLSVASISCSGCNTSSDLTWIRHYVWNAKADIGAVEITDVELLVAADLGGVQLWKDGPYWAECNVGATRPEECGYYFWWGDIVGYTREGGSWNGDNNYYSGVSWIPSRGVQTSASPFTWSACPISGKDWGSLEQLGYVDSSGKLVSDRDAATASLGVPWRMPNSAEVGMLINNCTTTWISHNGVLGILVTGKGNYASKSVFLPAAGTGDGNLLMGFRVGGAIWTSDVGSAGYSFDEIGIVSRDGLEDTGCYEGMSVRPLRDSYEIKGSGTITHLDIDCRTYVEVTFEPGGGVCPLVSTNIVSGSVVGEFPLPIRAGYSFVGWFTAAEGGEQIDASTTISNDVTLYAHWQPVAYSITYEDVPEGVTNNNPITYTIEDEILFTNLSRRVGYIFNGWVPDRIEQGTTGDVRVVASWKRRDGGPYSETIDGIRWKYLIVNGEAVITSKYTADLAAVPDSTEGNVVVPNFLGGCVVTSIGQYAFAMLDRVTTISLPDTVVSLGFMAFEYCSGLESIAIPEGVTNIGENAFQCCSGLHSIVIPSSVKKVGDYAFKSCTGLRTLLISEGTATTTVIGYYAFDGCTSLTSLTIPASVAVIKGYAFSGCSGLNSLTLQDGVTSIEGGAFCRCSGLKSVTIPSSVVSIGDNVFSTCIGLESITVDSDNKHYKDVDGVLFSHDGHEFIQYPEGRKGDYVMPHEIEIIRAGAFKGCVGLTSVSMPRSLTTIGHGAFYGCTDLGHMTIPDGVTKIDASTFYGCSNLGRVEVPESVTNICEYAFHDCSCLTNIVFRGDAPECDYNSSFDGTTLWYETPFAGVRTNCTATVLKSSKGWDTNADGEWFGLILVYECLVTYNATGGSHETDVQRVVCGSDLMQTPTPERAGYVFAGWYTASEGGILVSEGYAVEDDITLYAHWRIDISSGSDEDWSIVSSSGLSYDGQEQTNELTTVMFNNQPVTYTVSGNVGRDAGEYTMTLIGTGDFAGEKSFAWSIDRRALTLTSGSISKSYDGLVLSVGGADITADGYVDDECFIYSPTSSITDVGSTNAAFTVSDGTAKQSNYDITYNFGTLEVTRSASEIVVTAESDSWVYDGTAHTQHGWTANAKVLTAGDELDVSFAQESVVTRPGEGVVSNVISSVRVMRGDRDVTANYWLMPVAGELRVTPRPVTLVSADGEKTYDGTELTAHSFSVEGTDFVGTDGVTCSYSGTQTNAGSSENSFTYALNAGTEASNYAITQRNGTLKVNALDLGSGDESDWSVVLGDALVYSGVEQIKSVSAVTFKGLTADCDVTGNAQTDAGDYTMTLTGKGNFTGEKKVSWSIGRRDITLTSPTKEKSYDGEFLTFGADEIGVGGAGYVAGETFSFTNIARIADVGETEASFEVMSGTAKISNYATTRVFGNLKVTRSATEIVVTAASDSWVYDGETHTRHTWTATGLEALTTGDVLAVDFDETSKVTLPEDGEVANTITAVRVMRGSADVTYDYWVSAVPGVLQVTPRDLNDAMELPSGSLTAEEGGWKALCEDGEWILKSDVVGEGESITIKLSLTNAAIVSFDFKVPNCAYEADDLNYMQVLVDNEEVARYAEVRDWQHFSYDVSGLGREHTMEIVYVCTLSSVDEGAEDVVYLKNFDVQPHLLGAPTIDVETPYAAASTRVALNGEDGATLRYRIDEGNSIVYVTPFSVTGEVTICAWETRDDYPDSAVVTQFVERAQYDVSFLAGGHGSLSAGAASQILRWGDEPAAPTVVSDDWYTFTGWLPSIAAATADAVYTAQYRLTEYTLDFAGSSVDYHYGDSLIAPEPTTTNPCHTFVGWTYQGTNYAVGAEIPFDGTDTHYTEVWQENRLAAPVISASSFYECESTTVSISSETGSSIRYRLDGGETVIYTGPFALTGSAVIHAWAVRDNYYDSDESLFEVTRAPWTYGEYLDATNLTFETDMMRTNHMDEAHPYVLTSGVLGEYATNRLATTVSGPGTIDFLLKYSVYGRFLANTWRFDLVSLYDNGECVLQFGGEQDWTNVVYTISDEGTHELTLAYGRGKFYNASTNYQNCVWVDTVSWTPVERFTVSFDGNGGTPDKAFVEVLQNRAITNLPSASYRYHIFNGWYTEPTGGVAIVEGSVVESNLTVYAHWQRDLVSYSCKTNDDGTVTLTSFTGDPTATHLDVPSAYNGLMVTRIAKNAFWTCKNLESAELPDSLVEVEWMSFYPQCPMMCRQGLGCEIAYAGSWAIGFKTCILSDENEVDRYLDDWDSMRERRFDIQVVAGTKHIASGAFDSFWVTCATESASIWFSYGAIEMPDGLESIGDEAFGCEWAARYSNGERDQDCFVPASVTNLGAYAMSGLADRRIVFKGQKPSCGEGVFETHDPWVVMGPRYSIDRVYFLPGLAGWTNGEEWRGVETYMLDYIPESMRVDSPLRFSGSPMSGWVFDGRMKGDGFELDYRELCEEAECQIVTQGAISQLSVGDGHFFALPVAGATSIDKIKPKLELFTTEVALFAEPEVWTDEQLMSRIAIPREEMEEWDYYEDDEDAYECAAYDEANSCLRERYWVNGLWDDDVADSNRYWVVVKLRDADYVNDERWGGDYTFRVGLEGTSMWSPTLHVTFVSPNMLSPTDMWRGIDLAEGGISDIDCYYQQDDVAFTAYYIGNDSLPMNMGLNIPRAGVLYLLGENLDDSLEIASERDAIQSDTHSWLDGEDDNENSWWPKTNFYMYAGAECCRKIEFTAATNLRFQRDEDLPILLRAQFYPADRSAVAVESAFTTVSDNDDTLCSERSIYYQGRVRGTGVYSVGEKVSLVAEAAKDEAFSHWEVLLGSVPSGTDLTCSNLTFTVSDDIAGAADDHKQIVVRAHWAKRVSVIGCANDSIRGTVTGSGLYSAGQTALLKAIPADGYDFVAWSDGSVNAVREIAVGEWNAEYALYARFSKERGDQPSIEGDTDATVTGDAESGFVVTPGSNTTAVVVTIPTGVDAAKVTVEVSPEVTAVTPNGATVKIVKTVDGKRHDITPYLDLPAAVGGVIDLTKAEVKAAVAADVMDTTRDDNPAVITLDPTSPSIQTAPTKAGLTYTLREGATLKGMADGDHTVGDGNAWTPEIKVKGGASGFYSIKVGK